MKLRDPGAVLCVGEPLIALVPSEGLPLEVTRCLDIVTAGAELNVAVHLARLGRSVRYAGAVGADPFGRRLRTALETERIDVSALETHASRPTGFYLKEVKSGGTEMHYFRKGSAACRYEHVPASAHAGVGHVHMSGITPALSKACARLVRGELVASNGRTTSFDVNYRAALWDVETAAPQLLDLARMATVVFVGLDEARRLWGCPDATALRELIPQAEEVVVKDAARDATAFSATEVVTAPALSVEVVDTIGAGDAFAAGYLNVRWSGGGLTDALRAGHVLAATVIRTLSDHGAPIDPARASAHGDGSDP